MELDIESKPDDENEDMMDEDYTGERKFSNSMEEDDGLTKELVFYFYVATIRRTSTAIKI
jgi:hypothetical protein